ncbi:hypothetical protein Pelo_3164 [Pelomyxa schiedti]|nr:hypothetical protein Pelo_3164 [Pelomyxa schiedti]
MERDTVECKFLAVMITHHWIWNYMMREGSLFPNSVFATNLVAVKRHMHSLAASLGGTNIFAPLKYALGSAPSENYGRQIILFTDGAVSQYPRGLRVCETQWR